MVCVGLSERDLKNFGCPLGARQNFWGAVTPWHPPSSAPGTWVQTLHHRQTRSHGAEGYKYASEDNEWMIVQCATFYKNLNSRNIVKSVSDIRIRIRFPFESSFWITVSGCKLTILPDIQPANRIVIISAGPPALRLVLSWFRLVLSCV